MSRCVGCDRVFRPKWIPERKDFETHCNSCNKYSNVAIFDICVEEDELTQSEKQMTIEKDLF